MSTTYNGAPSNVSIGSAYSETIPADGDALAASSVNTPFQKIADFLEAFRIGLAVSFSEGFDAVTFPPTATSKWATPSSRFGADSTWVRTTTNPITSTASASAPVSQGASTNSSLGLDVFITSPSRMMFLFAVNGNANNSDRLEFSIDGVLTAQLSTQTSNTLVGGKFVSDVLREGFHTFDWRWVRGGSASVAAEECKIDTVEIIPESVWQSDPNRYGLYDEGFSPLPTAIPSVGQVNLAPWVFLTGTNVGTFNPGASAAPTVLGAQRLQTAATAAGDYVIALFQFQGTTGLTAAKQLFVEGRIEVTSLIANNIVEFGIMDGGGPPGNFIGWAWDGSLGAGSTWRYRVASGGVVSGTVDSGIASAALTWFRLGVTWATVRGFTGAVFTKDGKALAGTGGVPPIMNGTQTGTPSVGFRVRTVTGAAFNSAELDFIRVLGLR